MEKVVERECDTEEGMGGGWTGCCVALPLRDIRYTYLFLVHAKLLSFCCLQLKCCFLVFQETVHNFDVAI